MDFSIPGSDIADLTDNDHSIRYVAERMDGC